MSIICRPDKPSRSSTTVSIINPLNKYAYFIYLFTFKTGFRKNRGTRDHIFNLRMIIQKYREKMPVFTHVS